MKRRGFTLIEATVAIVILAVAVTVCLQMLHACAGARRKAEWRRLATREASNVMERVIAMPLDTLTPEAVGRIELSAESKQALPDATLNVRLDQPSSDDAIRATRITVEVAWQRHVEEPSPPIRLLAWRFHPQEAKP